MTAEQVRRTIVFMTAGMLIGATAVATAWAEDALRARAVIQGAPGSEIEGIVTFKERKGNFPEPGVEVKAHVTGLTPGLHGFHIHEQARCDPPGFTTAGGHFDPGLSGNSNPDGNHPFHMGDLPNLVANKNWVARLKHQTSRITLSPGPLSIFDEDGSVVIVHQNPDQGITGAPGSGVSGGPRIACGVIELVEPDEDDEDD